MPTDTEALILSLGADLKSFEKAMLTAAGSADRAAARIEARFAKQNAAVSRDFEAFRNQVATTFAALGVGLVVRDVTQLGDKWIRVGNALSSAGVQAQNLAAVQQVVSDIALRTNSDLEATADLFSRMLRSSEDLGASMADVAAATELVSKALAGADQSERAGAIRQLGQGLASGRLQGDELRSILENSRAIAEAIAAEFGVSIGKLRDLGKTGQLESRRVFEAIINAAPEIEAAFGRTQRTVADAWTNMETRAARYLGTTKATSTAQRAFIGLIQQTSENFDELADAALVAATVIGGALAGVAMGHAINMIITLGREVLAVGTKAKSLQALTSFLGGPFGIALAAAGIALGFVATQTDLLTSSTQALSRAQDSAYSALQVIANAQSVAAAAAAENAEATGGAADETDRIGELADQAAAQLDEMAQKSADVAGKMDIQARAARALAAAERVRAEATIASALADQQSIISTQHRDRVLRDLQRAALGVSREDTTSPRGRLFAAGDAAGEDIIADARRNIELFRQFQADLRAGVVAVAGSATDGGGAAAPTSPSGGSGPSVAELERMAALNLARLRHEIGIAQALEDEMEAAKRTAAYQQAGLDLAASRAKAEGEVRSEREAMNAEALRSIELSRLQDEADLARVRHNVSLAEQLSDEYEIRRRTRELVDALAISEAEAVRLATEFVAARREALEIDRQHNAELRDMNLQLEIARERGDERAVRALERRLELEKRIAELRELGLSDGAATTQAEAEVAALQRADLQGQFRQWFSGGIVDALNGEGDFFQRWIMERAQAGLENALNNLADLLFKFFEGAITEAMNGGQNSILGMVGEVFGAQGDGIAKLQADAGEAGSALKSQLASAAVSAAVQIGAASAASSSAAAQDAATSALKSTSAISEIAAMKILTSAALSAAAALSSVAAGGGGGGGDGLLKLIPLFTGAFSGAPTGGAGAADVAAAGMRSAALRVPKFAPVAANAGPVQIVFNDNSRPVFTGTSEEFRQFKEAFAEDRKARVFETTMTVRDQIGRRNIK